MMPGRVRIVVSVSLITVITLTGSIALPFFILDKLDNKFVVVGNPHYNGFAILALALAMILISFLVGGAVWRSPMARRLPASLDGGRQDAFRPCRGDAGGPRI